MLTTQEIKEHRAQGWEDEVRGQSTAPQSAFCHTVVVTFCSVVQQTTSTFDMVWLDGGHFFPITYAVLLLVST